MKYSIVINEFNRTKYVHRAIQSCHNLIKPSDDDGIEVMVVSDYTIESEKRNIINIVSKESTVGYRYSLGLKEATGDWIFLLDDDDYFLPEKLKRYSAGFVDFNSEQPAMVKEYEGMQVSNEEFNLKAIIKRHVDWHISEYSFNKKFKESLLLNGMENVSASLDKFIFAVGLKKYAYSWYHNDSNTIITNHYDSRMHSMDDKKKVGFYLNTAEMILAVAKDSLYQQQYLGYTYNLNMFLATGNRSYYNKIKYTLPLINRIYYRFRR